MIAPTRRVEASADSNLDHNAESQADPQVDDHPEIDPAPPSRHRKENSHVR